MKIEVKEYIRQYFLPENSKQLLSVTCFILGIVSIFSSLSFFVFYLPYMEVTNVVDIKLIILFVGLWACTLVGVANFLKK
jgi:hypothetical protein